YLLMTSFGIFFFQTEDGIRHFHVTGVQTCALPILEAMGLEEPGLNRLIHAGYALLDLITFFTAGPKEARAWTVKRGAKAPQAARSEERRVGKECRGRWWGAD